MNQRIGPKSVFDFSAPTVLGSDLTTWSRMLWQKRSAVDPRFIPRILVITLIICCYTPIIWWERLRFAKRIRRTEVRAPVFIIGHQRSGTTYLHYLLGKDPQLGFSSVKESFMPWIHIGMDRHLKWLLGRSMPEKRPMDNLKLGTDLPTEMEYAMGNMTWATMLSGYMFPSTMLRTFREHVLFRNERAKREWQRTMKYFLQKLTIKKGGKRMLVKAPEDLARVKEILEVFPDAKFIHIKRDPIAVYFSTKRLYGITLPMVAMQYWEADVIPEFILASYLEMFDKYFQDVGSIPKGQLAELRYEDLIGNELNELERVYAELGLSGFSDAAPFIEEEVKVYSDYKTNSYTYSEAEKDLVRKHWHTVFERSGYT